MTVRELIKELECFDDDMEVVKILGHFMEQIEKY